MHRYWISWWHPPGLGEFELHSPWWNAGYRVDDDAISICAAVVAETEEAAKAMIFAAFDNTPQEIDFRFCELRAPDWNPFGGRFRRAAWMRWPEGPGHPDGEEPL